MFDIGATEMMVVAIIAILFVGPKELPGMLRTFGQAVRKIRGLAGDFQRQMDDALREAELDGVKDSIGKVRNLDPTKAVKDSLNPLKSDLERTAKEIDKAAGDTEPMTFDDDNAPTAPEPVKVDVEAALARQAKLDKAAAKPKAKAKPKTKPKARAKPKAAAAK